MKSLVNNFAAWTTDQLLAEALRRCADDIPALRLMQGKILRGLLTAHDRELAGSVHHTVPQERISLSA